MKKLKREKIKLPVGSGNIISYFCLLALLIVALVVSILYIPDESTKPVGDNRNDKYGTDLDDELLNNSDIRCDVESSQKMIKLANKISITYTFDPIIDDKLSEYTWCGIDGTDSCFIEEYYEQYDAFRLDFSNIPINTSITVTNDYDDNSVVIDSRTIENGIYSFKTTNVDNIVKYKAEVRTLEEECSGDLIRTFDFTLPLLNMNYFTAACDDNSDPKCALVSYDALNDVAYTVSDVGKEIMTGDEEEIVENNKKSIKFNWYLVIIVSLVLFILITIGIIIFIIISEKRKKVQNEKI